MSIATYISQDIKQRIRAGATLPAHLSLTELSRHYDVSITPVREAIQALVEEGYLQKLENRRIAVNATKIGIGGEEEQFSLPKSSSYWDEVLLEEVTHASLSLAAAYLREGALAQKHGVGRSIIRGAFSRFAGAGLLDFGRGAGARPGQEADLRQSPRRRQRRRHPGSSGACWDGGHRRQCVDEGALPDGSLQRSDGTARPDLLPGRGAGAGVGELEVDVKPEVGRAAPLQGQRRLQA